jgi:uncharacterized protein
METNDYRRRIAEFIQAEAKPEDKFSHQPRLYSLATQLGTGQQYDDDVVYAAAWIHDIGVFAGHRPEDPAALATWNNVAYAVRVVPELLARFGFPAEKIDAVVETIRTHQPGSNPTSLEGILLRDADMLEQLGAVGILRMVSKVGRDTRYPTHRDAIQSLKWAMAELPGLLTLPAAQQVAEQRLATMKEFINAAESEMAAEDADT